MFTAIEWNCNIHIITNTHKVKSLWFHTLICFNKLRKTNIKSIYNRFLFTHFIRHIWFDNEIIFFHCLFITFSLVVATSICLDTGASNWLCVRLSVKYIDCSNFVCESSFDKLLNLYFQRKWKRIYVRPQSTSYFQVNIIHEIILTMLPFDKIYKHLEGYIKRQNTKLKLYKTHKFKFHSIINQWK